jgi:prepilin-type N-terminal cleavage/methylation domain-containing protein
MYCRLRQNRRGWTLIELMIIVVIVGVLAALAIPRFISTTVKSKQSEAQLILKQIYEGQRIYRQEAGTYWIPTAGTVADKDNPAAFAFIGVQITEPARYGYTIDGNRTSFTATATCAVLDDDPALDQWSIDQDGNLIAISDDVVN